MTSKWNIPLSKNIKICEESGTFRLPLSEVFPPKHTKDSFPCKPSESNRDITAWKRWREFLDSEIANDILILLSKQTYQNLKNKSIEDDLWDKYLGRKKKPCLILENEKEKADYIIALITKHPNGSIY